jgi:outer membrane protein insertion porin family
LQSGSLVKQGNIYALQDFVNERLRIDSILKERGYYYFNDDYLLFIADTTADKKMVNVWLKLVPDMRPEASVAVRYSDVYVADDFTLKDYYPDTSIDGTYHYVSEFHQFNPATVLHAVFIEKDSLYSRNDYHNTLRHVMDLGIYKFATVRFVRDSSFRFLKANVFLTPYRKLSLGGEVNANIKSTGYAGPGLKLRYKNRNSMGNAELFTVTLGGNFETQTKGDSKGQTSFQVTLDASITIPKFYPFKLGNKDTRSSFPKTIFKTGLGVYSRVGLYDLNSFSISAAYSWKGSEKISHILRPVDISYTDLANTTQEFNDYLNENPNVKKSFEEQFIIGGGYTFLYSDFNVSRRRHKFWLSESLDVSGNLVNAVAGATGSSDGKPREVLGVAYSQFIRITNEERYFYNLTKTSKIGLRLLVGAGIPYTNSTTMPYNRQYFAGGTSSIRAFLARSLGPGTYQVPDSLSDIAVDQAGDITIETSAEFRFDIFKNFKGALFVDGGNIWLVNEDPQRAGGKFSSNFYKEFAVGSGLGFRFDYTFIILRFDFAFPLRKPWLPDGERWVVNDINLGSGSWRRENLVLNIAIGYPF